MADLASGTGKESLAFALARRTLTQSVPFGSVAAEHLPQKAREMHADVAELATGFQVSGENVTNRLLEQQLGVADDLSELFPGDRQMHLVSEQIRAKVQACHGDYQRTMPRPSAG